MEYPCLHSHQVLTLSLILDVLLLQIDSRNSELFQAGVRLISEALLLNLVVWVIFCFLFPLFRRVLIRVAITT